MAKLWINGQEYPDGDGGTVEIRLGAGAKLRIADETDLEVEGQAFQNGGLGALAILSGTEIGYLDGAVAGTNTASKAVVNDSNGNQGTVKTSALHIGTSGSETQVTATGAELNSLDVSAKSTFFADFTAGYFPDELVTKTGSGTGNAAAFTTGTSGVYLLTSASDDGAFTANATALQVNAADWKAANGGLLMEARVKLSDVSESYIFIGFTDASQASTLEQPIFLTAADIDSDATDAVGVCYDVDGTTKQWFHGGVKANADTTPAYSGAAPQEGTFETIRVEVSAAGAVTGYVNGTAIGSAVANAVTASTALWPIIVVANRSANVCTAAIDYILVQQSR